MIADEIRTFPKCNGNCGGDGRVLIYGEFFCWQCSDTIIRKNREARIGQAKQIILEAQGGTNGNAVL